MRKTEVYIARCQKKLELSNITEAKKHIKGNLEDKFPAEFIPPTEDQSSTFYSSVHSVQGEWKHEGMQKYISLAIFFPAIS